MTRLDAADEREALKKEIKDELRGEERRRKVIGCLIGFLITVAILTVPALIVLSSLAKTGFVEVPVFSNWLYRSSDPVRVVYPLRGSTPKQVMESVTSKMVYDPTVALVTLTFREEQLTTLAQELLADPKRLPFKTKALQVAVTKDYIEIYAVSVRPKRNATVRLRFVPVAQRDGSIGFDVKELLIGSLVVPKSFSRYVTDVYGTEIEQIANAFVKGIGAFRAVELQEGVLTATLRAGN